MDTDPTTGNAASLNLASRGTDGRILVESHEIEGKVDAAIAKELIKNTADFLDVLLSTRHPGIDIIEKRFYGGRFPECRNSEDYSFFAIPRAIRRIKAARSQKEELAALFGYFHFWPIRYALSMSVYAANPSSALRSAREKHEVLTREFVKENKKSPDFSHYFGDLESIKTPEQVRERIAWFRRLDSFLEQALAQDSVSSTTNFNRLISTIALQLGSTATKTENSFSLLTPPGLIVDWKQGSKGSFAVTRVSLAE